MRDCIMRWKYHGCVSVQHDVTIYIFSRFYKEKKEMDFIEYEGE